jgi:hypothetical protein
MSLRLEVDTDETVEVKTWDPRKVFISTPAADIEIGIKDFCSLVEYVLSNTDLIKDDARLALVKKIKKAKVVSGWNDRINPKCKRLVI